MDETIEQIVKMAMDAVSLYGGDDRYMMLEEVARRLQEEAHEALMEEYMEGLSDE